MEDAATSTTSLPPTNTPTSEAQKTQEALVQRREKTRPRRQAEQAKIDAILIKVKDKGLHSLTWFEKRTLRKSH